MGNLRNLEETNEALEDVFSRYAYEENAGEDREFVLRQTEPEPESRERAKGVLLLFLILMTFPISIPLLSFYLLFRAVRDLMRGRDTQERGLRRPESAYRVGAFSSRGDWRELEEVVADVFRGRGYRVQRNVKLRGASGVSHEIDVLATYATPLGEVKVAVECKRHASPVTKDAVMKLREEIQDLCIEKGILVSTSGFTEGAIRYARKVNIELWDLSKLKSLLRDQARQELSL